MWESRRDLPPRTHFLGHIVLGLVLAVVFGFIFGILVMWLWNALMPGLFGLKMIGYWQGVGLVVLARLLFGFPDHHPQLRKVHEHCEWLHGHDPTDYHAWWHTEGRHAFDAYRARKQQPAQEEGEGE